MMCSITTARRSAVTAVAAMHVAFACVTLYSSPAAAQINYVSFALESHLRVHTRVEGVNDGRTVNQTHTISAPLPPQRFNFTGPVVSASQLPDPSPLDARGTIFPFHVEMRPQFFDWGNEYFTRLHNELSEQGRAQGQFDTLLVMTFTVGTTQDYELHLGATAAPQPGLPLIGGSFAYDYRIYRNNIPFDGSSRSAPPFLVDRVFTLEAGQTYRLEYETLALVNIAGLGPGGSRLETGLEGTVSVLLQPVPEPGSFAFLIAAACIVRCRRRGR